MIEHTLTLLKGLGIPVAYSIRPGIDENKEVISFHFYNEGPTIYGDGNGEEFGGNLQVDVFMKKPNKKLCRKIIDLLNRNNYKFEYMNDLGDTTTGIRLFHFVLIFNYLESEVLNEEENTQCFSGSKRN